MHFKKKKMQVFYLTESTIDSIDTIDTIDTLLYSFTNEPYFERNKIPINWQLTPRVVADEYWPRTCYVVQKLVIYT